MKLIKASKKQEFDKIKAIYNEAFPRKERKPIFCLKHYIKTGKMDLLMLYDETNDTYLGFITGFCYKDIVYFDFLAMSKDCRNKGYGSELLKLACEHYPNKRHCLIIERIDKKFDNYEQRVTRKEYYKRNHFYGTGYYFSMVSGEMEVLLHDCEMSFEEFKEAFKDAEGKIIWKLAKFKVLNIESSED